jgi:two-component system nitrogen regulation response regulator GlnG/two-component system response regulator HydG
VAGDTTMTGPGWLARRGIDGLDEPVLALVIAWSLAEPDRTGEVVLMAEGQALILGRGGPQQGDDLPRVGFYRQRPGRLEPTGPLQAAGISRRQLRIEAHTGELHVSRLGKGRMLVDSAAVDHAVVRPGDTVHIENQLLLLCTLRPRTMPAHEGFATTFAFGQPDPDGMVGESPASFQLREQIAFCARGAGHVLILGDSGSGKEIAARAIHRLSSRGVRPLCARNAATLPAGLIDAELFGNDRNYPNPGMRERPGLLGEADGSVLFLDEIGELPAELQAHLLRVLDAGGEYQRLGESRTRTTDVRLVAATNRSATDLKHDFASRFALCLTIPGLGERREDIPLVVRHLLREAASRDPSFGARFLEGWDGHSGEPRVDPTLMDALLRHAYKHHVRELAQLLWAAIASSDAHYVTFGKTLGAQLSVAPPLAHATEATALAGGGQRDHAASARAPEAVRLRQDIEHIERQRILEELEASGWNQRRAAEKLGIARGTLIKKLKTLGIKRPGV